MGTVKGFVVKSPLTVIGGVVTLVGMLLLTVWVFSATGTLTPEQRNYAFMSIVGLLLNAIPSLLGLLKSEATQHDLRNGVVKSKVKEAVEEIAADPESPANVLAYTPPPQDEEGKTDG